MNDSTDISYFDHGSKRIFFKKINDHYRFFCNETRKAYGPCFIGSFIDEELLKKWYPLKKTTTEHYTKELLAFSSPLLKIGQPFPPFTKKGKMEKGEGEDEDENPIIGHSKEEADELEDIYGKGSLGSYLEFYPHLSELITNFLEGRDKVSLIRSLPKDFFMSDFFRKIYASTNMIEYDLFSEKAIGMETQEQREIKIRKDEVVNLLVYFPTSVDETEAFIKENKNPLKGFDSLKSIMFNIRGYKDKFKKNRLEEDLTKALTIFIYQFVKNRYIEKIIINLIHFGLRQTNYYLWNCSVLKVHDLNVVLPFSTEHLDCDWIETLSDLSKLKTLHLHDGIESLPELTNLTRLEIDDYHDMVAPEGLKQLESLEILRIGSVHIDDLPPNLKWLSAEHLQGTETVIDPNTSYPRSLSTMIVIVDYFIVPSWLEKLSIYIFEPVDDDMEIQETLDRSTRLKKLALEFDRLSPLTWQHGDRLRFPFSLEELTILDPELLGNILIRHTLRSFSFKINDDWNRIRQDSRKVLEMFKDAQWDPFTSQRVPLMIQEITLVISARQVILHKYLTLEDTLKTIVHQHKDFLLQLFDEIGLISQLNVRLYVTFDSEPFDVPKAKNPFGPSKGFKRMRIESVNEEEGKKEGKEEQ